MSEPEDPGAAAELHCPRCSAPLEPHQEYCLECGSRLPPVGATGGPAAAGVGERHRRSVEWLAPALVGLLIAVVGTGAAIAISDEGAAPATVPTATGGSRTAPETTSALTAPEPTGPARTPAPAPRPPSTTARPPATLSWPRDRRGWTVVLVSLPQAAGRELANERAAEARRDGVPDVGVLDSSRFASLHPGYFVVFSGIFESQAEATGALPRARAAFPLAYQRQIVP